MKTYCFWNNKGGTGKTSLAFQVVSLYANINPKKRILVLDLCPQANLSELLLGGLKRGGDNLQALIDADRRTAGGYFQERILTPYRLALDSDNAKKFLQPVHEMNENIPRNIDLLAGDPLVELQANSISEQATAQLPGENAWARVISWISDFINVIEPNYDTVFIDANPSFSIYTQIALAATNYLIIPTMADDSSKRAIINVLALLYGINMPNERYKNVAFSAKMAEAQKEVPQIMLIIKNRLTQYMGPATAFGAVLKQIDELVTSTLKTHRNIFAFTNKNDAILNVTDFGTTGVVSFVEAVPFYDLTTGVHLIGEKEVQVNPEYKEKCARNILDIVRKID